MIWGKVQLKIVELQNILSWKGPGGSLSPAPGQSLPALSAHWEELSPGWRQTLELVGSDPCGHTVGTLSQKLKPVCNN